MDQLPIVGASTVRGVVPDMNLKFAHVDETESGTLLSTRQPKIFRTLFHTVRELDTEQAHG